MFQRSGVPTFVLSFVLVAGWVDPTDAAIARFHYVVSDEKGSMTLAPSPETGSIGERVTVRGTCTYQQAPVPTHYVTFRHTVTGQCVTVPVRLPEGTPIIMHRSNHYIYNYGSYTVTVHFLADGSVDVVYNSGLFRGICP